MIDHIMHSSRYVSVYMMTAVKYNFYILRKPSAQYPRKALSSWAENRSGIPNLQVSID